MLKLNLPQQRKCHKLQILDHLQGESLFVNLKMFFLRIVLSCRNVTEIYTASTFLEDLYDDTNRTFTIAAISKGSCLALTPVLGKLILTRFPDKSLRDVLNNIEPFEVVTDKTSIDDVDFYVHDQRMFRNNPVRQQVISCAEWVI